MAKEFVGRPVLESAEKWYGSYKSVGVENRMRAASPPDPGEILGSSGRLTVGVDISSVMGE